MNTRLRPQAATTEEPANALPTAFAVNEKGLPEKVFVLRQKLYRKAKTEPGFRFYTLYDRILRHDVLAAAWDQVARNDGAPGVDGVSIADVVSNPGGVAVFLENIQRQLRQRIYRPQAVRRKLIPKANGTMRPLGIPTVRDRVVQAAAVLVLEPIFEADFMETSFGFRPKRSAHDALGAVIAGVRAGRTAIVDADLKSYFDTIPHEKLMACVERRIADRSVLQLIRMWLRTPIAEDSDHNIGGGSKRIRPTAGTPQGGVVSPLLANVYLHWLDKLFMRRDGPGTWAKAQIVRYADDFVILARYIGIEITQWMERLLEGRMGLTINREKTRVVQVRPGESGIDFLGYTIRYSRGRKHPHHPYLTARPSKKSVMRFRERLRGLVNGHRTLIPLDQMAREVNSLLRGWSAYFSRGHRGRVFNDVNQFVYDSFVRHMKRRSQRSVRPPEGTSWYALIRQRLGVIRI